MLKIRADLHMHTCLSPCAEIDMTPRGIVAESLRKGLDLIAITDHNSAENVEAAQRAAIGTGLGVLAGMEIGSSEEVHILALFESADPVRALQCIVHECLPGGENDERLYGDQIIVNENNEVMGFNRRLLIAATSLTVRTLVELIRSLGGISVASHVDRQSFSVLSQLGFIPEDLHFDALEISPRMHRDEAEAAFPELQRFPWVSFSDAHRMGEIGRRVTTFTVKEPTLAEVRRTFSDPDGRAVSWD